MSKITIDFVERIEVDGSAHHNELKSLQMLFVGLRQLAVNLKNQEAAVVGSLPANARFSFYGNPGGSIEPHQLIACYSHWFAISACNYARLVGYVRGFAKGEFSHADLSTPSRFNAIKAAVDSYVDGVAELHELRVWRDKVGAHFAITAPRKHDNTATLELSVMHPVVFRNTRYEVGGMRLTRKNSVGTFTSELPTWSLTQAFEQLIPRYWPNVTWQPPTDPGLVDDPSKPQAEVADVSQVIGEAGGKLESTDEKVSVRQQDGPAMHVGAAADLLAHWRQWRESDPPHQLGIDEDLLASMKSRWTVMDWQAAHRSKQFGAPGDKRLHLGLLPQPFCGDIVNASIYVLMLNPGLGSQDYFGEYEVPEYRQSLLSMLRQEFSSDRMPFLFLDPRFAWHGGFGWWHDKLARVIERLAKAWSVSFAEARARLGGRLASIELVPYHSVGFDNAAGLARKLPSAQLAASFVADFVLPRVEAGKAIVIVARKARVWNLTPRPGVVIYSSGEARGANLGPLSLGGKAILNYLLQ